MGTICHRHSGVLVTLSLSPGGGYIAIAIGTGQGFVGVVLKKTNMLLVPEGAIVPRRLIHRKNSKIDPLPKTGFQKLFVSLESTTKGNNSRMAGQILGFKTRGRLHIFSCRVAEVDSLHWIVVPTMWKHWRASQNESQRGTGTSHST
jgi:hypothetical protein